ncbi:HAD family phosphatase [Candidatus Peregrinibacteria bacterium]|nr:MAG: HAD family phosphatase [Candidatus Peregrinibacteria bacterium]
MTFPSTPQEAAREKALKHPFKAVAFDVDGTLTHFARFTIPTFMAEALVKIPENIPRAICTGRDLRFIHRQLLHICSHSLNPDEELKRWWVFAENGGVGYRWNTHKKDFEPWYEVDWPEHPSKDTLEAFGKDKLGWSGIFLLREHSMIVRHPDWTYLFPKLTRILSKHSHRKLDKILGKNGWTETFMVQDSGIGNVILPRASGKGSAMQRWAKQLGLNPKDILVVGDQPRPGENDESFLCGDNGTAFSVGSLIHATFPLPVRDERGRRLKGPEGTAKLLEQVRWDQN